MIAATQAAQPAAAPARGTSLLLPTWGLFAREVMPGVA